MNQEFLGRIQEWMTALEGLIQNQPRDALLVIQVLIGAIGVLLLLLVRGARKEQATKQAFEREIRALREAQAHVSVAQPAMPEEAPVVPEFVAEVPPRVSPEKAVPSVPPAEVVVTEVPEVIAVETSPIAQGLQKSRVGFLSRMASFFSGRSSVDSSMLEDLEEVLILSDVGVRCAQELVGEVREAAEKQGAVVRAEVVSLLKEGIRSRLVAVPKDHRLYQPNCVPLVVLVVGVNGVGKTTTVAKLAAKYKEQGKKVLAIAADTFRAAAVEQLAEWSTRVGFTLVRGPEGAKPGAVVFDGIVAAKEGGYDVVLIDTAGRLHTKSNLMQELEGVRNAIRKHIPDAPHETVLVLDGVSGQNALSQAREFNAAVALSGIVVTKLDGTPKGGIIVAISQELQLPVFFVGVGERVQDLVVFDRQAFVDGLFEESAVTSDELTSSRQAHAGNT
jgi:fused signal recognition particle receptor